VVLWPLLTPTGGLFNNLEDGDFALPQASIAGFTEVLAVMAVVIWLAFRHQRRTSTLRPMRGWRDCAHRHRRVGLRLGRERA
jgi:hypothetical protein